MPTAPVPEPPLIVQRGPSPLGSYRWDDTYTSAAWTPVVGPTAMSLYRLLNHFLDEWGSPLTFDPLDLARMLGGGRKRSRAAGAFDRLVRFELAFRKDDRFVVTEGAPRLSDGRAARVLPAPLVALLGHDQASRFAVAATVTAEAFRANHGLASCCADPATCPIHGFGPR